VSTASFDGGTHIFIKGSGFDEDPQSNGIIFWSNQLNLDIVAPALTLDDQFNSHPLLGTLAYRLPSISDLFGMPKENFDSYWEMTFSLKVMANG
jgi:hypothetical protein